jgi:hypothetical protein
LKLADSQWQMVIVDSTSRTSRVFATQEEGRAAFNDAEWLQEDVTDGTTHHVFPYPDLAWTAFWR